MMPRQSLDDVPIQVLLISAACISVATTKPFLITAQIDIPVP